LKNIIAFDVSVVFLSIKHCVWSLSRVGRLLFFIYCRDCTLSREWYYI